MDVLYFSVEVIAAKFHLIYAHSFQSSKSALENVSVRDSTFEILHNKRVNVRELCEKSIKTSSIPCFLPIKENAC